MLFTQSSLNDRLKLNPQYVIDYPSIRSKIFKCTSYYLRVEMAPMNIMNKRGNPVAAAIYLVN